MEELSCKAPVEKEGENIEEFSSLEQEGEKEAEQEQTGEQTEQVEQDTEGQADNPAYVDGDRASPQFCIIDSQRVFDHPASAGFRW